MTKVFYGGCWSESGHYLHDSNGNHVRGEARGADFPFEPPTGNGINPWPNHWDGGMQPKPRQAQGVAKLTHLDGWTALGFEDHSIDKRPVSISCFMADGLFTFDEMVALAKKNFPKVWARYTFPVVLWSGK